MGSPRFWSLVVAAVLYILAGYGIVPNEAALPVATLVVGTVGVGTIDRLGKNIGLGSSKRK